MAYPKYWNEVMTKLQDFRWQLGKANRNRKPVKITIEFHHKRFGENNKEIITLNLKSPEMESIVYTIEKTIMLREMELSQNIEAYESKEKGKGKGADTVGGVDREGN